MVISQAANIPAPADSSAAFADSVFSETTQAKKSKPVREESSPKQQSQRVKLMTSKGSIVIYSEPPRAEVVVNSVKKGVTPLVVKLSKKSNRIVVRMRGYKTYDVMIEKNTLRRELTVALKPEGDKPEHDATVSKPASKPGGAGAANPALPPTAGVSASPVQQHDSEVPTGVETGRVFLSSSPSHADISIDGNSTGWQTPVKMELSVGAHHIEMTHDGLRGSSDFQVLQGRNKALLIQLQ